MASSQPHTHVPSAGFLSQLDARVKLLLLLVFVATLSFVRVLSPLRFGVSLVTLTVIAAANKADIKRTLLDALYAMPVAGFFALVLLLSGDKARAVAVLGKTYLSSFCVLLVIHSTSLPKLTTAAATLGLPRLIAEVSQLIFQYLHILRGEALSMQNAIHARSGKSRSQLLRASSGTVAVLFMRSLEKSDRIFKAMVSRGFRDALRESTPTKIGLKGWSVLVLGTALMIGSVLV